MSFMFYDADAFNQDIGSWDVSSVTDMQYMFAESNSFDQDISGWDVLAASVAPGDPTPPTDFDLNTLPGWTTAEKPQWGTDGTILYPLTGETSDPTSANWRSTYAPATYVYDTTPGAEGIRVKWNDPITSMNQMFYDKVTFNNADINSWDVSTVTDMTEMFYSLSYHYFNQPLSSWNTSNVTTMQGMFWSAFEFNQDISSWDTSNVTDMDYMFLGATAFNNGGQPLVTNGNQWNVSNVTSMNQMFTTFQPGAFNQDISSWDVSSVTNMTSMFSQQAAFDQNLNTWNVSLIPSIPSGFADGATLFTTDEHPLWGTTGVSYLVNPTYGTLVAYYNLYGHNNANGYELNAVASTDISALSPTYENRYAIDSYFASLIANGTTITYDFGNFGAQRYAIADLLAGNCNVRGINTTTIGPSAFSTSSPGSNPAGLQTHWHHEITGNDLTGQDYSFMSLNREWPSDLRTYSWNHRPGGLLISPAPTSGTEVRTNYTATTVAIYIV
jgi:surface protein